MAGQIRLVGLRPTPLDVAEVLAAVADDAAGGLALCVGTVRDHDEGKAVTALGYSAHPHAEVQLREVAERVVATTRWSRWRPCTGSGQLAVADLAVVVAVSRAHRGDAFAACRRLIDDLKAEVAIWKH